MGLRRRNIVKIISGLLALSVITGLAQGDELPHRKAGLWEIVSTNVGAKRPLMTQRLCLDRETDALLNKMGLAASQQACAKSEMIVTGNRATLHVVCNFGRSQLISDGVVTYSGDSSYRNEIHGRLEPPMAGSGDTHTVQDGKWIGACPAHMKPGDLVMIHEPGGHEVKMNLRAMFNSHP
jgi:hypothetical protein